MALLVQNLDKFLSLLRKQKEKKIKGATLIESLVASVIIVIIFTIASLTLNNVFESTIKSNTSRVQHRMHELEYLHLNDKINYPYQEEFENWNIQLMPKNDVKISYVFLQATHKETKKNITKKLEYVGK